MSLTKEIVADKIEVIERDGTTFVQVRTTTKILESGEVISSSYHRHVINSGDDFSSEPENVKKVCNAVF
tara:strand:+ start:2895 stop:3101 length:207 start_codon:yes stop_codon:yes gene_type:complete